MEHFPTDYIYYADACLVFMVTGVICGVVRLIHHCRPYDKEAKYFYPASYLAAFLFMAIVMQFPYFLRPCDESIWHFVRIFGIIYYPAAFAALFLRYFRWQKPKGWNAVMFFFIPMLLLLVLMIAVMFDDSKKWLLANKQPALIAVSIYGLILAARMLFVLSWLKKQIDNYHKQNFSNERDFPHKFAKEVMWLPIIWMALMWIVFIWDNRDVKMIVDLVLSVWMVAFLGMILHPQRLLRPQNIEAELQRLENEEIKIIEETITSETELRDAPSAYTDETSDDVRQLVLGIILRKYKEQHLQKTDVLAEVDSGKKAPANRFIAKVGYYNLINMFRLEHARLYAEANPNAKQSEVAEASGFASGSSFSKAKRSVRHIDPDLVSGVHL